MSYPIKKFDIPVLIVDDIKANRDLIKIYLHKININNIILFENGNEAYEYIYNLKTNNPIILITDLLMPEIDGLSLLKKLRNFKNVYSIVITGQGCINNLKAAFDAGAIDFIKKPFVSIELTSRIKNIIRTINTENKLRKVAVTDFLTGVYNRKYFIEQAKIEILKAKRCNHTFSLLVFDIDNFKNINDTFGHQAGDKVMKEFCSLCKSSIRGYDYFCRFGGDEFALTLINSSLKKAEDAAERIRNEVNQLKVKYCDKIIKFTVSIGVTELSADKNEDIYKILVRADKALYKAKKSGRNTFKSIKKDSLSN